MATKIAFKFIRPTLEILKPPEKGQRLIVRDTDTRGLELRVTSNRAKTFSVNHRIIVAGGIAHESHAAAREAEAQGNIQCLT